MNVKIAVFLIVLSILNSVIADATAAPLLRIVIVEGEGATNNIRQRTTREPIVQVVDENDRPVSSASVLFLLPGDGAGGTFADGSRELRVLTDENGRATARGYTPNNVSGVFRIQVQASYLDRTASTVIRQTNVLSAGAISGKLLALIAIAGGAAAGAAVALTGGGRPETPGQSPAAPTPGGTTITAVRPAVGGTK